jgi:peptide/nickel transport system permease protein
VSAVGRALRHDAGARAGLCLILLPLLAAALAGPLAPGDPLRVGTAAERLLAPSPSHPLGTDALGRDVLGRLMLGGRASLAVGWSGVLGAVLLGTLVGLAAGLGHARLDRALMGLTDLFLAFPRVFLVLLLAAVAAPSLALVAAVIAATGWMGVARLVRAETLALRDRPFVVAARSLELPAWRLAARHVLPHVLPLVVLAAALRVGGAILLESFLSYLGLGAQDPTVSWGAMIEHGHRHLADAWWLAAFPGLAIALTAVGHNLLGDALRDALDPRAGGRHDAPGEGGP